MKKCDLHVHSCYSNHPNEWFLKKIGASESYTKPEEIYEIAKSKGMDYVTITDHNTIDGVIKLKSKYPDDVFTGVELTTYFPEDSCKVHILVYDFTEKEFFEMDYLRKNIYELSDYINKKNLAHSVAHPTYKINNTLSSYHIEKLLLLFNNFEVLNAARDQKSNMIMQAIIKNLNIKQIKNIENKYFIKSILTLPWNKGMTAGSDDHSGLFISKAYTAANVNNMKEFIESIKNRKIEIFGSHNNYYSFVFTIYKIAYEFYKSKNTKLSDSIFNFLFEILLQNKKITLKDKFKLKHLKNDKKNKLNILISDLLSNLKDDFYLKDNENKFLIIYNLISDIVDELLKGFLSSLETNLSKGDIHDILKNLSSSLPAIFLSLPFFTSIMHFNQNKNLLDELVETFNINNNIANYKENLRILWFTDTINDLNGVSTTINLYSKILSNNKNFKFVSCKKIDNDNNIYNNIINLPCIYTFDLPFYESLKISIPSILKTLKIIQDFSPDEIIISTPGPVGLIGLLSSKLLNIKSTGIFHTDFSLQIKYLINDDSFYFLSEKFLNWFYSNFTKTLVPTYEYIEILSERGYDTKNFYKMKRGIDLDYFYPIKDSTIKIKNFFNLPKGKNLLYAGRISKDKNLEILFEIVKILSEKYSDINLIIAGDGPYLNELKENYKNLKNIYFLGKVEHDLLPLLYSSCFAFVFPSTTDTFGMSVLEAQACGLICLVSDKGGPKEIIINNQTGFICSSDDISSWIFQIEYLINLYENNFDEFLNLKTQCRLNAVKNFNIYDSINFLLNNEKNKLLNKSLNMPYLCFNLNQK